MSAHEKYIKIREIIQESTKRFDSLGFISSYIVELEMKHEKF